MGYVDELLAPGETVLLRTRRHWIVLARWAGAALVLVVLGLTMAALFGFTLGGWPQGAGVGVWAGLALAAVGALAALPGWLRWFTERYLVTDRRVIQVEGVLRKQALDSGLSKVNDVRLTQGALARLLGYGTLEIITASESGINRLDDLPHPMDFKKAMMAGAQGAHGLNRLADGEPATTTAAPTAGTSEVVVESRAAPRPAAERLAELEEVRRKGLVSEREYAAKREEIVRSL
jgi:uncharacterized membrane protein YdbT with pleckstrin-like domain